MSVLSVSQQSLWLLNAARVRPVEPSPLRLFCFPHSGASAAAYAAWSLPPQVASVCPVELPGRGRRLGEALYTRLPELVEEVARGLLPYFDRPFAFFGHSMGALLSFELARTLRRDYGLTAARLFLSGHGAPHLPSDEPPISGLPEAEFLARLRQLNGTEDEILACEELRQILLPILRADFAICENYAYLPADPLDCPITAFGGLQDPYVSRPELEAWQVHTRAAFRASFFPGDHFYLNAARPALLDRIACDLAAGSSSGKESFWTNKASFVTN
jgi:medium-chain acyl-[acyl-carrier-protein] hydrolase